MRSSRQILTPIYLYASQRWVGLGCISLMLATGCFGQSVEPLNPNDTTLPMETRRWIAAAEDGVVVARARRDAAIEKLRQMELRQARIADEIEWSDRGRELDRAMRELADARVVLAQLGIDRAEAELMLAQTKYELANAERAILHDLALYELQPLRDGVAKARQELQQIRNTQQNQRLVVEKLKTKWWKSYSTYISSKGDTRPFWIGSSDLVEISQKKSTTKKAPKTLQSLSPRTDTKVEKIPEPLSEDNPGEEEPTPSEDAVSAPSDSGPARK